MKTVRVDRYRAFGFSLGLVIIASVFLLPFTYRGARPLTLYEVAITIMEFWGDIQRLPPQDIALNYVFITVFSLLVFAGIVGFSPLVSGLISVSAMVAMISALFFIGPQMVLGVGYYAVWVASLATLCAGIWLKYG
jgi:hypothetical protein